MRSASGSPQPVRNMADSWRHYHGRLKLHLTGEFPLKH